MRDLLQLLLVEVRGAWRFRWIAIGVAWVVCIIGWPVVLMLPDQFEASAQFYIDTSTRLDEVIGGVVIESDETTQIELVRNTMLSRPVLEKVARETDLDLRATSAKAQQDLLRSLKEDISIRGSSMVRGSDDSIYSISYRDPVREKSLSVVGTILDTFREDVVSGRAQGSDETVEFLRRELAQYADELQLKERALAEFKKTNVGLLPGESGGYFETLQRLIAEARRIRAEIQVVDDRRNALLAQLRGENPALPGEGSGDLKGVSLTEEASRIAELEAEIDELLTQFTEKWPDVIAARSQLEQLKQRQQSEVEGSDEDLDNAAAVASTNPVYQQIRIALNDADVERAALQRRLSDTESQIAILQERVDVIPTVEAELAQLTRDYEQIQAVYAQLRVRLEQEELRRKRIGWDGVTFKVIEPPVAGIGPVWPNRSRLLFLVLVGALICGGGIAYLLQQLNPVFIDSRTLSKVTGVPVLGSVSMAYHSRHRAQRVREVGALLGATGMMIVGFVLVFMFQDAGVEFGSLLR